MGIKVVKSQRETNLYSLHSREKENTYGLSIEWCLTVKDSTRRELLNDFLKSQMYILTISQHRLRSHFHRRRFYLR